MVQDITLRGLSASQAVAAAGVSTLTAHKWRGLYQMDGAQGLLDKSSRPAQSPRAIAPEVAQTIVELRRKCSCRIESPGDLRSFLRKIQESWPSPSCCVRAKS